MNVRIHESWQRRLAPEFTKPYFAVLADFVRGEYLRGKRIFPAPKHIFAALDAVPFEGVRVVILGQDPYHGPGQAHGFCFSVPAGIAPPPSLVNIYKEMQTDLGVQPPASGDLTGWAAQGVLLLNATLTVEAHKAGSHQKKGWEEFTDAVIRALAEEREGLVFVLWGAYAQRKGAFIDRSKHLVLASAHPSPLSAYNGFFGSRPFSRANEYLKGRGAAGIDWARTATP